MLSSSPRKPSFDLLLLFSDSLSDSASNSIFDNCGELEKLKLENAKLRIKKAQINDVIVILYLFIMSILKHQKNLVNY